MHKRSLWAALLGGLLWFVAAKPVLANEPPAVSLSAPGDGQRYTAPASIALAAVASDADGSIARVDFYANGTLLGTRTAAPYTLTWSAVGPGSYSLTAQATDALGAMADSAAVTVAVGAATRITYLHADHLGTPRLATDAGNVVVWRHDPLTEPFGAAPVEDDPDGNGVPFALHLRFPGQYFDQETNLAYNVFRDYDPSNGRYLQSDPIGLAGGINTYLYVEGNPLTQIDPLGLVVANPANRLDGPLFGGGGSAGSSAGRGGGLGGAAGSAAAAATGAAISNAMSGGGADSDSGLQQDIEREANRREYKNICGQQPPPGLDPCERAKWELDKAKACKAAREENTRRWWGGVDNRHSAQLFEDLNRQIRNAERAVERLCKCN